MKLRRYLVWILILCLFVCPVLAAEAAPGGTQDTAQPDGSDPGSPDGDTADAPEKDDEPVPAYNTKNGFPAIDDFSIAGNAALLYDLSTDTLLYGQNLDEKIYPASLAKVLTCLVAIENGNLEDEVTVSSTALQNIDIGGTTADLSAGEVMKLEDLLYCVMLASANEACNVVAEHIAGSIDAFVEMLNRRAAELGCSDSHFANTHGLHNEEEYTTVRNLMYIARAALQNETFCEIAFSTSHEIPATNLHEARTLHTTNYLVSEDLSHKYYYSKAAGVKTGYTSKAGRCLITTAQEDGLYLLSIVTGCESTEEMNGEIYMHSFPESKRLLEYGMSNFVHLTALSPLVPVGEAAVSGSDQSSVVVVPVTESAVTLPAGYAPQDITTEIQVNGGTLQAPVTAGDIVGTVTVYYRGVQMASAEITTIQDVSTGTSAAQQLASGEQSDAPKSHFSMWTVVLIVAILLVAAYLGLYTYRNLQRRKHKSKKRRTAKRK